ncbi:hypothetical protein L2E82_32906 [Cichorium intybus]|uniref:Uncharacterized protein n=1 Tax=Cichorium intybus TaxID=13427 RepID=A0ACB9BID0_CICIN|nr:hypothetical protein L2E82_32906 [Cichorium intybus]
MHRTKNRHSAYAPTERKEEAKREDGKEEEKKAEGNTQDADVTKLKEAAFLRLFRHTSSAKVGCPPPVRCNTSSMKIWVPRLHTEKRIRHITVLLFKSVQESYKYKKHLSLRLI